MPSDGFQLIICILFYLTAASTEVAPSTDMLIEIGWSTTSGVASCFLQDSIATNKMTRKQIIFFMISIFELCKFL